MPVSYTHLENYPLPLHLPLSFIDISSTFLQWIIKRGSFFYLVHKSHRQISSTLGLGLPPHALRQARRSSSTASSKLQGSSSLQFPQGPASWAIYAYAPNNTFYEFLPDFQKYVQDAGKVPFLKNAPGVSSRSNAVPYNILSYFFVFTVKHFNERKAMSSTKDVKRVNEVTTSCHSNRPRCNNPV